MNKRIVGKCSQCGGIVSVPTVYLSVVPPVPQCERCHAVQDVTDGLPIIKTIPFKADWRRESCLSSPDYTLPDDEFDQREEDERMYQLELRSQLDKCWR